MDYVGYSDYESRTAGTGHKPKTVQAWKTKKTAIAPEQKTAQAGIIKNLEKAQNGKIGRFDAELNHAMAYAPQQQVAATGRNSEDFQFGDVIDVINPLHHLPVIGMVYRGLTNDQLHPMSQIIGGALYGGPIGAVTGTVNAVAKVQTGKDVGDHMLEIAGLKSFHGVNTQGVQQGFAQGFSETPLEGSTLALADLKYKVSSPEKVNLDDMPPFEPIKTLKLSSL